jgi:hypothetical protein
MLQNANRVSNAIGDLVDIIRTSSGRLKSFRKLMELSTTLSAMAALPYLLRRRTQRIAKGMLELHIHDH